MKRSAISISMRPFSPAFNKHPCYPTGTRVESSGTSTIHFCKLIYNAPSVVISLASSSTCLIPWRVEGPYHNVFKMPIGRRFREIFPTLLCLIVYSILPSYHPAHHEVHSTRIERSGIGCGGLPDPQELAIHGMSSCIWQPGYLILPTIS